MASGAEPAVRAEGGRSTSDSARESKTETEPRLNNPEITLPRESEPAGQLPEIFRVPAGVSPKGYVPGPSNSRPRRPPMIRRRLGIPMRAGRARILRTAVGRRQSAFFVICECRGS